MFLKIKVIKNIEIQAAITAVVSKVIIITIIITALLKVWRRNYMLEVNSSNNKNSTGMGIIVERLIWNTESYIILFYLDCIKLCFKLRKLF